MNTIAHIRNSYLPKTETFIYNIIKSSKNFRHLVLTKEIINRDTFPYDSIFSISNLNKPWRQIELLTYGLLRKSSLFENVIREKHVELLHAHFGVEGVFALPLKKKFNIPLITSFYGYDAAMLPYSTAFRPYIINYKLYLKDLFQYGDLFLTPSESLKQDLIAIGCSSEKIKVYRLGIDLNLYKFKKRAKGASIKFLCIARFVEKKGIEYLIKAFSKLNQDYDNVELKITGNGPLRDDLIKLSRNLKLEKKIVFLNNLASPVPQSIVVEELYNSDILVSPSVTAQNGDKESLNLTNIEAQATGMPVISTWHDGIPEGVIDGKTGYLVPERDVEGLYIKMKYLMEHPELWHELGKAGRHHIESNYNLQKQIKELENIYMSIIK